MSCSIRTRSTSVRMADGFEWGGVFAMNPKAVTLAQEEYDELVRMIREKL